MWIIKYHFLTKTCLNSLRAAVKLPKIHKKHASLEKEQAVKDAADFENKKTQDRNDTKARRAKEHSLAVQTAMKMFNYRCEVCIHPHRQKPIILHDFQ